MSQVPQERGDTGKEVNTVMEAGGNHKDTNNINTQRNATTFAARTVIYAAKP